MKNCFEALLHECMETRKMQNSKRLQVRAIKAERFDDSSKLHLRSLLHDLRRVMCVKEHESLLEYLLHAWIAQNIIHGPLDRTIEKIPFFCFSMRCDQPSETRKIVFSAASRSKTTLSNLGCICRVQGFQLTLGFQSHCPKGAAANSQT